jgi:hypothetical protein
MKYDLRPATPENLTYVWERLREKDRAELSHFNMHDHNFQKRTLRDSSFAFAGYLDDEPFCILGGTVRDGYVQLFFFGTPQVNRSFKTVYRFAKAMLHDVQQTYPLHVIACRVWAGYPEAKNWLERMGFVDGAITTGKPGSRLHWMVWSDNGIRL